MFNWFKKLFGSDVPDTPVIAQAPVVKETAPVKKTSAKKTSKKGSGKKCDFSKLTKPQLLAEAKHRGVKANASMNKQDILDKLNAESKK